MKTTIDWSPHNTNVDQVEKLKDVAFGKRSALVVVLRVKMKLFNQRNTKKASIIKTYPGKTRLL